MLYKDDAKVMMMQNESMVFDNPDYEEAMIGMTSSYRAVYDYDKMVECLVKEDMTYEDAEEFISYNTLRSLPYAGDLGPIVIHRFEEEDEETNK